MSIQRFQVVSYRGDAVTKHHVKPLEVIWRKLPELYGAHNTLHVDDVRQNTVVLRNLNVVVYSLAEILR